MKVSVIIPFYNEEKYIKKAISSVKNQSFKNFECILVDNGSEDNSTRLAEESIKNDNRFKIIYEPEKGIDKALNRALDEAKGEFLTFLDADDWFHEDRLRLMVNEFDKGEYDIVICKSWIIDERNGKGKEFPPYWFSEKEFPFLLFRENLIRSMSYIMTKRDSLVKILPFPEEYNLLLDYYIAVQSVLKGLKIKFLNKNLVFKRYHSENMAHDRFSSDLQDIKLTHHFFYNYPSLKSYFSEKEREIVFTRKYIRGANYGRRKGMFEELKDYMGNFVARGFIKKEFFLYFSALGYLYTESLKDYGNYIESFAIKHPFFYFLKGICKFEEKEYEKSLELFGKAYSKALENFPEALNSYAITLANMDKKRSLEVFDFIKKTFPFYRDAINNHENLSKNKKDSLNHTIFLMKETMNYFLYL